MVLENYSVIETGLNLISNENRMIYLFAIYIYTYTTLDEGFITAGEKNT